MSRKKWKFVNLFSVSVFLRLGGKKAALKDTHINQ